MDLCCIQCAVAEIVDNQRSMRLNSQGSYANFTAQGQTKILQSFVSSTSVSRKLFSQEKQQNKSRFSKWPTSPNADYGNYDKKKKKESGDVIIKWRKEVHMQGWVNKTLDFYKGDHCLFPVSNQHSTLVSFNHEHDHSITVTKCLFQPKPDLSWTLTK